MRSAWIPAKGDACDGTPRNRSAACRQPETGSDPNTIGSEARLSVGQAPEGEWASTLAAWRELGATHLGVNTMGAGLESPPAHIEML